MEWSNQYYLCLECEDEFKNDLNIAICPKCLEKERNNYQQGIPPKYNTVAMLLKKEI